MKTVDFSETIEACDLKVVDTDFMKVCKCIEGQDTYKNSNQIFSETTVPF